MECVLCFKKVNFLDDHIVIEHHIKYFPVFSVHVCVNCHALIHQSNDPIFDSFKQYKEGDREKWLKTPQGKEYLWMYKIKYSQSTLASF